MEGLPAELIMAQRREKIKFTWVDQVGKREQSKVKQRIFQESILREFHFMETPARNALSSESFSYEVWVCILMLFLQHQYWFSFTINRNNNNNNNKPLSWGIEMIIWAEWWMGRVWSKNASASYRKMFYFRGKKKTKLLWFFKKATSVTLVFFNLEVQVQQF